MSFFQIFKPQNMGNYMTSSSVVTSSPTNDAKIKIENNVDADGGNNNVDDSAPSSSKEETKKTLYPLYLHQWIDVQDTEGTWLEAQVIQLRETKTGVNKERETEALIHYKGWKPKYDEWVSATRPSNRIALYFSKSTDWITRFEATLSPNFKKAILPPQFDCFGCDHSGNDQKGVNDLNGPNGFVGPNGCNGPNGFNGLAIDTRLDVFDSTNHWLVGKVLASAMTRHGLLVLINYAGWDPKYDEWIPFDSHRFAALYTFTRPFPSPIPNSALPESN